MLKSALNYVGLYSTRDVEIIVAEIISQHEKEANDKIDDLRNHIATINKQHSEAANRADSLKEQLRVSELRNDGLARERTIIEEQRDKAQASYEAAESARAELDYKHASLTDAYTEATKLPVITAVGVGNVYKNGKVSQVVLEIEAVNPAGGEVTLNAQTLVSNRKNEQKLLDTAKEWREALGVGTDNVPLHVIQEDDSADEPGEHDEVIKALESHITGEE